MYEDKTLQCRECGQDFVFSAGEQEFYQLKGTDERTWTLPRMPGETARLAMAQARTSGERATA